MVKLCFGWKRRLGAQRHIGLLMGEISDTAIVGVSVKYLAGWPTKRLFLARVKVKII
jgi:hypothetical protein